MSAPRASYTAWREMAPISARTTLEMSSAVLCGRSDTARSTARRWAVTCRPCRRSSASLSTDSSLGTPGSLTSILESVQILFDASPG